jgi:hypothetical protein
MYGPLVTSAAVLANLVRGAIETREHPMIEERDEAVAELALGLEEIVRKRLSEKGAWDPRYVSLDGIQTHRVETDGSTRLRIVGAFYLLDEHGHRMLPVDADLSIKPGAVSTIKIADAASVFDMPTSERRFIAAIEQPTWQHSIRLALT